MKKGPLRGPENGHSRTGTIAYSSGETADSEIGGAESGASAALRDIAVVWPWLTDDQRASVVRLVASCAREALEVES